VLVGWVHEAIGVLSPRASSRTASYFLDRLKTAKNEHHIDRIFNFDDTSWKRYLGPNIVLSEKGTEAVKLKTMKGEKEDNTKGKTDLCHPQFRAPNNITIRHNPTGWTNDDMMLEYLSWLSE
jgi:hypothetical protein